ncbi:MAG: SDR family oxidoreductase, partial [Hyphomicrobium sp.]|nr:SDR family oxidoreductase [Hyphomicrobium sp.]
IPGGNVSIASVTDGTSNTIMYSENGHGLFSSTTQNYIHEWSVGQPSDVADVVAFLAGPESRWVTGQVIEVAGGTGLTFA